MTRLFSASFFGLEALIVEIEVDIATKAKSFDIVGMAGVAVKESVKRIESAINNSGFHFPGKRITVNLAPAGVKKVGTLFDLPIALGIINDQIDFGASEKSVFIGELSLDGRLRRVPGALPITLHAREKGFSRLFCPVENYNEIRMVRGIEIIPVDKLEHAVSILCGNESEKIEIPEQPVLPDFSKKKDSPDMSDIRGQESSKRALEIAAAGGHNALMIGPPGTGKTMLAKRLPEILPDMEEDEALETTMIYSVAGLTSENSSLIKRRPFRSPHHTASDIAIIGGGKFPRPGEVSLSHNGVLFLDEFQLFRSNVLQVLRQPMEDREVTISRAEGSVRFPARFMLVAALNPSKKNVDLNQWDADDMHKMLNKLSGPLLDRMDIQIQVSRIAYDKLKNEPRGERSADIRKRVVRAREIQRTRFKKDGIYTNAEMTHKLIEKHCPLSVSGESLLKIAMEKFVLSIRSYDKILKIARSIADLEGEEKILDKHIAETLQYRVLDRILNFIN